MNTSIVPSKACRARPGQAGWLSRFLRRALLTKLTKLSDGHITIIDGDERHHCGTADTTLSTTITVRDPRFWTAIALGGSVGAGASYRDGAWDCDDLTALVRILCRNRHVLDAVDGGANKLAQSARAALHWCNRNTIEGSRRNIAAHYDIGNELYERMLDPTMMYSSAVYPHAHADLASAQEYKCELLCRKLDLFPEDHLLEIGTGWGGFAMHAAEHYNCRVTTTTISEQQYQLACERVAARGLADRVTVLKQDYRDLQGSYDKIVSIEMIEAVGWQFYPTFFDHCDRLLKDDGVLVMQAITIADQEFERAKREVDFIKRFIFPGSCIPSVTALSNAATKASSLRVTELTDITPHYARTLADWRDNCHAHTEELNELGYGENFQRLWDFYLGYCEGGFAERAISVAHLTFAKPGHRQPGHTMLGYHTV